MIWEQKCSASFQSLFVFQGEKMVLSVETTKTDTAKKVFTSIRVGEEFNGLEFKRWCVKENPKLKYTYEETFLRILRKHFRSQFICIDRAKSKYKKVA